MTVEAALVFPLFVMLWIPFLYLLRYCIVYETASALVCDAADTLSVAATALDITEIGGVSEAVWKDREYSDRSDGGMPDDGTEGPVLTDLLTQKLASVSNTAAGVLGYLTRIGGNGKTDGGTNEDKSNTGRILEGEIWNSGLNLIGSQLTRQLMDSMIAPDVWKTLGIPEPPQTEYSEFLFRKDGIGDRITVRLCLHLSWPDPFGIFQDKNILVQASTRSFRGLSAEEYGVVMGEGGGAEAGAAFYRIGSGTHYHSADCYLIEKEISSMSQAEAIALGYHVCEQCCGQGDVVYTTAGGERYHSANCPHLFPDLHVVTEEEIQGGAYTPCSICQGGGGWFTH